MKIITKLSSDTLFICSTGKPGAERLLLFFHEDNVLDSELVACVGADVVAGAAVVANDNWGGAVAGRGGGVPDSADLERTGLGFVGGGTFLA